LIDLDVSCAIGGSFGTKKPSSGYCPPEMARVLLDATKEGKLVTADLKTYTANVRPRMNRPPPSHQRKETPIKAKKRASQLNPARALDLAAP
jgi:hypothetical protein